MLDEILEEIKFNLNLEDFSIDRGIKIIKNDYEISEESASIIYREWKKWYMKNGYILKGKLRADVRYRPKVSFDEWIMCKARNTTKSLTKMDYIDIALSYGKYERKIELMKKFNDRGLGISLNFISVVAKEAYDLGYLGE